MTDPVELNQILSDLASGKIDADQAAARIAASPTPPASAPDQPQLDLESLYDSPPARAAEPADQADEADDWAPPQPEQRIDPAAETEPPVADEAAQPQAASSTEADEQVVFGIDLDDVAATAGEVLRDAGGFAKSAFQRIGHFASSVLPEAESSRPEPAAEPTAKPNGGNGRPAGSRGVERLVLRSVGRRVRLIGDPKVGTIAVDGPHTLRRQGVTLEVSTEGELGLNLDGFSVVRPPRSVEDLRVLGFGRELVVRVNPAIPVDAEVTGSRLTTENVPYLGKIRVSAGGANLSGVVEITDALMQAGGATLSGPLSEGRSRVRVESGNLSVQLTRGANVTIRSTTQLGRISWPGEPHGELDEYVVGNGSAQLEIGVVMGRAVVRVEA